MRPLLGKTIQNFRLPAARQLFQGADIEITVVEVGFQLRHVFKQETTVLSDAVTANRRFSRRHPLF
ncbi:putative GTPase [Escherichia coli P12b]|nr:putative GTPase [Escherichia coli P12b]